MITEYEIKWYKNMKKTLMLRSFLSNYFWIKKNKIIKSYKINCLKNMQKQLNNVSVLSKYFWIKFFREKEK